MHLSFPQAAVCSEVLLVNASDNQQEKSHLVRNRPGMNSLPTTSGIAHELLSPPNSSKIGEVEKHPKGSRVESTHMFRPR